MKRILILIPVLTIISFSATSEQVEKYLSVSDSEEQLIQLQQQFSAMQAGINQKMEAQQSDQNSTDTLNYDMQLITVRFRESLAKELSEEEMNEVLEQYKDTLLLQFVSTQNEIPDESPEEIEKYIEEIKSNTEYHNRLDTIKKISKLFYKEEYLNILFENLIQPLMQQGIGGESLDKKILDQSKKNYAQLMQQSGNEELIFLLRDFTDEELELLVKILESSASDHEAKAVYKSMAYALQDFFMHMASRYNTKSHQQYKAKELNNTK